MVGAVGELRSTEVGGMEETLNGVEGMVPGDRERSGFRNRPKRCLEIRQVRDLLEVVANIDDAFRVSQREALSGGGGVAHVGAAEKLQ